MTNYARLLEKPQQFYALIGYTLEEFHALLPAFDSAFGKYVAIYTLEGKSRGKRSFVDYKNSPLPTIEDKLAFIMIYLRKATTQDIFGEVFGMPQPVANKWIHILHPCLNQALKDLEEIPVRQVEDLHLPAEAGHVYFQDGTERPIPRPKDALMQSTFYSGKRKHHTVKNNVLVNEQAKIVLLSDTCEGKKHDKKIADEAQLSLPEGSYLYQDTGFQGYSLPGVTILQPKKKPRGGELTAKETDENRQISRIRILVEHAIGGSKRYRIVKDQVRNWKNNFRDQVMETCCGLHNFRLNFRPWHYDPISAKS
jgi:hypothetical protein